MGQEGIGHDLKKVNKRMIKTFVLRCVRVGKKKKQLYTSSAVQQELNL